MSNRKDIKVLIITGAGLNCEKETAAAFSVCGATAELVHLNDLFNPKRNLNEFHILALIGGFSFGDHLGSGTVFANKLKFKLTNDLSKFIDDGKLVIGICNGFQTLTRLGLVPAIDKKYLSQQVSLTANDSGVFRDDWVTLKCDPKSPCIFTKGIDTIRLPIRHGEGKFVAKNEIIETIENKHLVALRYCKKDGSSANGEFPINPNGSIHDIAGICDETGRIFGLMPHPEAYLSPFNAPNWQKDKLIGKLTDCGEGRALFENAVQFASDNLVC